MGWRRLLPAELAKPILVSLQACLKLGVLSPALDVLFEGLTDLFAHGLAVDAGDQFKLVSLFPWQSQGHALDLHSCPLGGGGRRGV